jgi:folylpolyglutamate synthase/dihydropteroate synthase
MEVFTYKNKTIILDGSHNQQKMAALVAGLEKRYPDKSVAVMLGFINSRADRVDQTVAQIMPLAEQTIITAPDMVVAKQDVRHQSLDTDVIKTACLKTGAQKVRVIKQPTKALEALLNCPQQVLLVTGSFYLMSQIRPLVRSAANHD